MKVIEVDNIETILRDAPFKCIRGKKEYRPNGASKSWLHSTLEIYLTKHCVDPKWSFLFSDHKYCNKVIRFLYFDTGQAITIKQEKDLVTDVLLRSDY